MDNDRSAPVADLEDTTAIAPRLRVVHPPDGAGVSPTQREIVTLSDARDVAQALGRLEDWRFVVTATSSSEGLLRRLARTRAAAIVVDLRVAETRAALLRTIAEVAEQHGTTAILAIVARGAMARHGGELNHCDDVISDVDLSEDRLSFALLRALERRNLTAQLAVARREILLSEASLLLTLLSAAAPSVVLDEDGRVVFANREAERVLDRPRAALYGRRAPPPFDGGIGSFTLPDGNTGARRLHDILWERRSATLVVLVRDAHDVERWRAIQAHVAVGAAHLDHADDAITKLRQVLRTPNVDGDIVADVIAGLARDLSGARGSLERIARR
jgi:PAS domain-containing protein